MPLVLISLCTFAGFLADRRYGAMLGCLAACALGLLLEMRGLFAESGQRVPLLITLLTTVMPLMVCLVVWLALKG